MKIHKRQSNGVFSKRGSGVLLHITCLPARYGIGDFGPSSYKFADFLAGAKQSYWQVLPLTPTNYVHEYSPYNSLSAFAGNKYLISPTSMMRDGLLRRSDLESAPDFSNRTVQFPKMISFKNKIFKQGYQHFKNKTKERAGYEKFCKDNISWLEDFALFVALKSHLNGRHWTRWPAGIKHRDPKELSSMKDSLAEHIEREKFLQYVFSKQWYALKSYCNNKGIKIIGDIPMYVDFDSVDVWVYPQIFKLGREMRPAFVSGVPPDYFSENGQLWGNPVYRWNVLKSTGYQWWIQRIGHNLKHFDVVRLDHFRGFIAYWQVAQGATTAKHGRWVKAPARHFLQTLRSELGRLPLIAEDLGTITPDVREIIRRFNLPGMRVLLFAFGGDETNPYLPHNHEKNCVVYTGTHDNNTVRGWFVNETSRSERQRLFAYLGKKVAAGHVHEELLRVAMSSVADTAIVPMQDILGLGGTARMNRPATIRGNWRWRLLPKYLNSTVASGLLAMTQVYGRV